MINYLNNITESKPLGHNDESGFQFAKEMLDSDATAAINFDRFMKHPEKGFIIMEYLLCEETQKVDPYTSHPNRYWNKNRRKFLSLWRATLALHGTLYLVNYAKKGTAQADKVLLIEVKGMNEGGITEEIKTTFTREGFKSWFRELNRECLSSESEILTNDPVYTTSAGFYHYSKDCVYIKGRNDYSEWDKETDRSHYEHLRPCKECVIKNYNSCR